MQPTDVEIRHDEIERTVTAFSADTEVGHLTYIVSDGTLNIDHTFVEPSMRGKGIAGRMMSAAEDYAKRNGLKVTATCSYAAHSLRK